MMSSYPPINTEIDQFNQLVVLFNAGRHVEIEDQARQLVGQQPNSGLAWKALGISLRVQGKDALSALQNAAKLLPGDAEAQFNLGAALTDQGQPDAAVASYRRALEIKPDFAEAHNNLGNVLRNLGRFDEAVSSYRRALEIGPNFAEAYNNLGIALTELGRLDEAAASFRRALAIKPNYAAAHRNLGFALNGLGQLDAAVASYGRALEIKPDYAEAHNALGNALMGLGQPNAAVASYRRALEIAPGDEYATHMIAAITGSNADRAPDGYVTQLFDGYAEKFDTHLVGELGYRTPEQIVALIREAMAPTSDEWDVLDLGCGTGLVGAMIAPHARHLVGVDLSQKMLEKARARNIYTRLENCELLDMTAGEPPASYDIVTAADVFVYVGRLDTIFAEVERILRPGSIFGFTVEALDPLPDIQTADGNLRESWLLPTGRFAHSSAYVKRLALEHGFKIHRFESIAGRLNAGVPVQSWMVLLERTEEGSE